MTASMIYAMLQGSTAREGRGSTTMTVQTFVRSHDRQRYATNILRWGAVWSCNDRRTLATSLPWYDNDCQNWERCKHHHQHHHHWCLTTSHHSLQPSCTMHHNHRPTHQPPYIYYRHSTTHNHHYITTTQHHHAPHQLYPHYPLQDAATNTQYPSIAISSKPAFSNWVVIHGPFDGISRFPP